MRRQSDTLESWEGKRNGTQRRDGGMTLVGAGDGFHCEKKNVGTDAQFMNLVVSIELIPIAAICLVTEGEVIS